VVPGSSFSTGGGVKEGRRKKGGTVEMGTWIAVVIGGLLLMLMPAQAFGGVMSNAEIMRELEILKERTRKLERALEAKDRQIEELKARAGQSEEKPESEEEGGQEEGSSGRKLLDRISFGGVIAGVYQGQFVEEPFDDLDRGAFAAQPEIGVRLTDHDEIALKLGFAAGNGLNGVTDFNVVPWGGDLEDDVKEINGRNRDYLLTAWYKHTFEFREGHTLGLTGGLVDATDYLDENAYSNDEYTQYMNAALVNGPNAFLPSYDLGGALEWEIDRFAVNSVYMNVGENDDGKNFNFFGTQLSYRLDTPLGEGNYRIIGNISSEDFLNRAGTDTERRAILLVSCDQQFGDLFGGWIRLGVQDGSAAVDYRYIYSGGINITGKIWGREQDNIGLGYGYLGNGNGEIKDTHVAEAYVRFMLTDFLGLTLDAQYMRDRYDVEDDVEGVVLGVRMAAEF
jgi:porin